jgi:acyl-CoA thioester hydrolase
MLRAKGLEQDHLRTSEGIIFAVRSAQVDYLSPARFNELLQISVEVTLVKNVSLTFRQAVTRGNEVLATGLIRIACIDTSNMRPKVIPKYLLEQLTNEH